MKKFILLLVTIFLVGCGNGKVYLTNDAKNILPTHKVVAILPPQVTIPPSKKVDAQAVKNQEAKVSIDYQKQMFSKFLQQKKKRRLSVDFQDIETTNVILQKNNYQENSLTKEELCQLLGVDAIITSNYALPRPLTTEETIASIGTGLLKVASAFYGHSYYGGYYGQNQTTSGTISLFDKQAQKVIWNNERKRSDLIKFFAKSLPYKK